MTLSTYSAVIRIDTPSGSSNTFRTQALKCRQDLCFTEELRATKNDD